MELYELFAALGAVGLIALYFKIKQQQRSLNQAREALFEANNTRAKEIHKQVEELEKQISKKKDVYAENVRKFRALTKPDGDSDRE